MATFSKELKELFEKINSTPDFSYVDFKDIDTTNALGENALHITASWGDVDAVKLLIEAGININKAGEYDYTPLHYSCMHGHKEVVEILLNAGANPYALTMGDLPFTTARAYKNDDICDLLSKYMGEHAASFKKGHIESLKRQIAALEKSLQTEWDEK